MYVIPISFYNPAFTPCDIYFLYYDNNNYPIKKPIYYCLETKPKKERRSNGQDNSIRLSNRTQDDSDKTCKLTATHTHQTINWPLTTGVSISITVVGGVGSSLGGGAVASGAERLGDVRDKIQIEIRKISKLVLLFVGLDGCF